MHYHYKESELSRLLNSMVILVDTREKENRHITSYLEREKIAFIDKALDYGDYSYMIPANKDLGIIRDTYFTNSIVIERKNSLEELSGNLSQRRREFENELIRSQGARLLLMIENATYDDVVNQKYKTNYNPKSFVGSLKTFEARYGISVNFIDAIYSGHFIYHTFKYHLKESLKRCA